MVHDDGPVGLDGVAVCFDDERVVSEAGNALVATLAQRLGVQGLAGEPLPCVCAVIARAPRTRDAR